MLAAWEVVPQLAAASTRPLAETVGGLAAVGRGHQPIGGGDLVKQFSTNSVLPFLFSNSVQARLIFISTHK